MSSSKRILIIEDDRDIGESLVELLEDQGYETKTALNGRDALELLSRDNNFDLVLLDLMMPILNGFEFRQEQLKDPKLAGIPVIIMSADGHVREKRVRTKCRDYVKKPISDLDSFLVVVSAALKNPA